MLKEYFRQPFWNINKRKKCELSITTEAHVNDALMITLRVLTVCLTLALAIDTLAAFYQLEPKCPYADWQQQQKQHYQATDDCLPAATSAAHSSASATAEVELQNSLRPSNHDDLIKLVPATSTYSNSISGNLDYETSPQLSARFERNFFTNYFPVKKSDKLQCAIPPLNCINDTRNYYYRTMDGSCNNLEHPGYGQSKSRYARMMLPKYSDRSNAPTISVTGVPLPNARLLSLSLYGDVTMPDNFRTLAHLQWGQLVAHDLTQFTNNDAPKDCCTSSAASNKYCYPITLHPHGPIASGTGKSCMHFARSTSDSDLSCAHSGLPYNEKVSIATAYLDLSSVYGNSLEQSHKVRQYEGGLMKVSIINNRPWLPVLYNNYDECGEDNYQCYNIPDMRNQFIPYIAILHTIILREHNRIANALAQLNPHYSDEHIFQEARKINIAQYQKITYYDWLPLIIGPSYAYTHNLIHYVQGDEYVHDYDSSVNPAPYAEFSAAAFRYSHNQIPGWFSMVAPNRQSNQTMRLSDYFGRPENVDLLSDGENFDSLIRGLATQFQKKPDTNIDREIKHHFDRKSFEQFGADLKAIDIQRGRDYGLPSYNDFRQYCGLPRAYDWAGFANEISPAKIAIMEKIYASPDDVDLSIGGSLESHAPESSLGPTFQCIIGKQFLKSRTGDRFFFEREDVFSGFTREQLTEIRKSSISGLFCNNGDYLQFIQSNSFIYPNTRNLLKNCNSIPRLDLTKWKEAVQQPTFF